MENPAKKIVVFFSLLILFTTLTNGEQKVMKRVGSLIKVKPEYEERYIILHRNTFPGVLDRIRKSNIRNYSIFLLDDMLFSYYEYTGQDYEADMKAIADPVTKDWWKLTDPMQEPLETRKKGEWWAEMDQMICLGRKDSESKSIQRIGQVAEVIPGKEEAVKDLMKNAPADLEETFNKENFQNLNIFFKDGKLYFYFEYTGNDMQQSLDNISRDEKFISFQNEFRKYLVPRTTNNPWLEMREVFHTN